MDLLQNKLDRLTPEQRREVEDFVDFLLFRPDARPAPMVPPAAVPPVLTPAVPETVPVLSGPAFPPPRSAQDPEAPLPEEHPAPEPPGLIQEIAGGEDGITREYLDYGKFDREASPADEAVQKVKRKLVQRGEDDRSRRLLDWID